MYMLIHAQTLPGKIQKKLVNSGWLEGEKPGGLGDTYFYFKPFPSFYILFHVLV